MIHKISTWMRWAAYVVLTGILFTGCRERISTGTPDIAYDLEKASSGCLDSLFSDISLIELRFDGDHYPSSVNNLRVSDKYIFVEDNSLNLFIFDSEGRYISNSRERYGMGPGEFTQAMGWSWNPYSGYIEILTPDKIMFYDVNFNFINSCNLPSESGAMFDRIFDTSETNHYLIPTGVSDNPYRIIAFNSSTGETTARYSYGDDVIVPISMQHQSFFRMPDGELMFAPPAVTYNIYQIDSASDRLNKSITLIPGNNWLVPDASEGLSPSELMTSSSYIPLKTFVSPRQILIMTKRGLTIDDMDYFAVNRETHDVMKFGIHTNGKYTFPPIHYIDNDFAYAAMERASLDESPELITSDREGILGRISGSDSENLILVRYRFR